MERHQQSGRGSRPKFTSRGRCIYVRYFAAKMLKTGDGCQVSALLLYDFAHLAHKPQYTFSYDLANQSDDLRFR